MRRQRRQRYVVYDFEDGTTAWVRGGYDNTELYSETQKHGKVIHKLTYFW